ncbi:MAG: diacylglycerol/lipid kinase family protein, partial [Acidimicrobiia bacterium]
MLRARLIMNPEARGVGPAAARVVVAALEAKFKLDHLETEARATATEAARLAVEDGCEVVIAFGGDGLVNEVANGVSGTETALAVIPGGTMNVFARNLGMPRNAIEAADRIIRAAERNRIRKMPIASVNGRVFTFACGCGFDAEAATRLEERRVSKRRFGEPYFYATALATFLASYRKKKPFLEVSGEFGSAQALGVLVMNGGTYAYLLGRPVRPVPRPRGEDLDNKLNVLLI